MGKILQRGATLELLRPGQASPVAMGVKARSAIALCRTDHAAVEHGRADAGRPCSPWCVLAGSQATARKAAA